jgi:benzoyl-CoA 2,3-dioxygenase component B
LLAPQEENRVIPFGENYGQPAWQEVPGESRNAAPIVIQGDTEPVRGAAAPSRQDCPRSTICATCFRSMSRPPSMGDGLSLQKYFGCDGCEEADDLLRRCLATPIAHAC